MKGASEHGKCGQPWEMAYASQVAAERATSRSIASCLVYWVPLRSTLCSYVLYFCPCLQPRIRQTPSRRFIKRPYPGIENRLLVGIFAGEQSSGEPSTICGTATKTEVSPLSSALSAMLLPRCSADGAGGPQRLAPIASFTRCELYCTQQNLSPRNTQDPGRHANMVLKGGLGECTVQLSFKWVEPRGSYVEAYRPRSRDRRKTHMP